MVIESILDVATLQSAINKLKSWSDGNDLHLKLDKCVALTINRGRPFNKTNYNNGGHIFKRMTEQRDLGVIIDNKLNFAKHIDAIISKAIAALGFIQKILL